jgi:hypothetical protein
MNMYTTRSTLYTTVALTLIILFCKNVRISKSILVFKEKKFVKENT